MTREEREAEEQFAGSLLKWIINNNLMDQAIGQLSDGSEEGGYKDDCEYHHLVQAVIFTIPPEEFLGNLTYSRETYHWTEKDIEYEPSVETLHKYEAALREELKWAVEEKKRRIALLASATDDDTTEET